MSTTNEDSFSLPTKLFEPETEPTLESHINYNSRLSLFDEKWDRHFKDVLDRINTSPFGAFYRLAKDTKFVWSGTLVHFLLANQLVTNRKYELWSLFGGQPIRFSLKEFGFITGLSCEHYPTDHVEDNEEVPSRWTRMLKSKKYPSLQNLEEMALECSGWSKDDRIRLAYLMILAGILMARHRGTPLPRETIELVRNIPRFEKYPWGRTAFKILIDSVHEVKDDLCHPSYAIDGFVQVLQIWGYEAVPLIAKKVKAHAESAIDASSIMLKWKGSRARLDYFGLEQSIDKVDVNAFLVNENPLSILAPQWKDEIQDPLVSNLIGEIFCTTKFEINIWVGHGLKQGPSRREILTPKKRRKKRKMSRVLNEEEVTETEELVTRPYMDSCIKKLHKAISEGFDGLKTQVKGVDTKLSELEKQVKAMQQSEPRGEKNQSLSTASSPIIVRKCTKKMKYDYDVRDGLEELFPQTSVNENNLCCSANMDGGGNKNSDEKIDDYVQIALPIPSVEREAAFVQTVLVTSPLDEKTHVAQNLSETPLIEKNGDSVQFVSIPSLEIKDNFGETMSATVPLEKKVDFVQTLLGTSPLEKKDDSVKSVSSTPPVENNDDLVQIVSPTPSLEKNFKTRKLRLVDAAFDKLNAALRAQMEKDARELGLAPYRKPRKCNKKKDIKSLSFYDPFGPIDKTKLDALNDWNKLESNELDLGLYKVRKQFWEILITETKWLHSGHIDACLTFLRRRLLTNPSPFRSERMNFLDTYFSHLLCSGYKEFLKNTKDYIWGHQLIDYYHGVFPGNVQTNKKFWIDVDDLYTVINLDNGHWAALAISLAKRKVDIYDSLISHTEDKDMEEKVAPYAHMIPHLIKNLSGNKRLTDTRYKIRRVKNIPQNLQSGDCGVYAIKYIECLALNADMKLGLSDKNIGHIRRKLASEVFDEARK